LLRDEAGAGFQEFRVRADVRLVRIGKDEGPDRLIRDFSHAGAKHVVRGKRLSVHEDQSVSAQAQQCIAALAREKVQARLDQLRVERDTVGAHWWLLLLIVVLCGSGHDRGHRQKNDGALLVNGQYFHKYLRTSVEIGMRSCLKK
jgi:hypothetical protein